MMFYARRCPSSTLRHLTFVVLGLLLCTFAFHAAAQLGERPEDPAADPDAWLLESRWGEVRYGLTVREPIDALRVEQPPDRAVARWVGATGVRISLEIHQGMMADARLYRAIERADGSGGGAGGGAFRESRPLRLNDLILDLTGALDSLGDRTVINSELHKWVEVGPHIGYINYFAVTPRGQDIPWLYGVALLQLDDFNIVVLRMECDLENAEEGTCTLESMLHSIEVETSDQVRERLRGWMLAGDELLSSVTQEDRLAAMRPDRLYRILELRPGRGGSAEDADIGYMRIWQRHQDDTYYRERLEDLRRERQDPRARLEGIDSFQTTGNALVVQSFYQARGSQINRLREYVDADPDQERDISELWNLKTELRQPGARYGRDEGVWVETGVRDDLTVGEGTTQRTRINRIQVVREGTPPRQIAEYVLAREQDPRRRLRFPSAIPGSKPSGDLSTLQWETPERAYLSQVDAMLVPALLPDDEERTYGFFVYHAETSRLAIRVMRVVPREGGGKYVFVRPTIDRAEEAMEFDANGELVRWLFPDGRSMVQTTREELARIWNVRLPRD